MDAGYSFVELSFVLGLAATLAGVGVPQVLAGLDEYRTVGAVRYLVTRIQRIRIDAVARSTNIALQVTQNAAGFSFAVFADGNGDGVRTKDIQQGIDAPLGPAERLSDNFSGVDFGVLPGLPAVDSGSSPPGTDPIKLGSSNLLSFSPIGTATSGSLYVRGRGTAQYVVRITGETGRVHILKFDPRSRDWKPV